MNLPYDAYLHEIEALCKEFAPVDKVVVPRDPSGLARGYAFVYLQKASDVPNLIDYVDGRHLRSRQIRAKASLGGDELKKVLMSEKQQPLPDDAERLARYKAYARGTINTRISSSLRDKAEEEAQESNTKSFSVLEVFEREVTRLQSSKSNMSQVEAERALLNKLDKQGKSANLSDYEL